MKALVVGHDRVLADVVAFTLRREGFHVIQAHDSGSALQRWADDRPDLVVLDVDLPELGSFALCQRIREQADTPILLLAAQDEEEDVTHGLGLGADDYVTKPVSPRQLVARARSLLQAAGREPAAAGRQIGELALDLCRREMRVGRGGAVSLTSLECQLLDFLMLNSGQALVCEDIISHVWGSRGGGRGMLRQLVRRLRGKLARACSSATTPAGPDAVSAVCIKTVQGLGYALAISPPAE